MNVNAMNSRDIFRLYAALCIVLFLVFPALLKARQQDTCPKSAHEFWSEFRESVLDKNEAKIISYTSFPFQVKGALDDSSSRYIDVNEFKIFIPKLFEADPGLTAEPTTMKRFVSDLIALPAPSCNKLQNQLRVGQWVFEEDKSGWHFIKAYIED